MYKLQTFYVMENKLMWILLVEWTRSSSQWIHDDISNCGSW